LIACASSYTAVAYSRLRFVARQHVEIVERNPVACALGAIGGLLEQQQSHRIVDGPDRRIGDAHAIGRPRIGRAALREPAIELAQDRIALVVGNRCLEQYRPARLPVVTRKIVGDAAGDVCCALPEIRPAAPVEIDGVSAIAPRHELRHAHRAGERSLRGFRGIRSSRASNRNCFSSPRKNAERRG
jgi:hypothetical protein